MAAPKTSNALLLLYEIFNTLDANGPLEVFRKSGMSKYTKVTIASENEFCTSAEGAVMKRHIPIDDALIDDMASYDLIIVPGGASSAPDSSIQQIAKDPSRPYHRLVKAFVNLPPRSDSLPRVIMSVCSGAMILSGIGIFNNMYCTTHWDYYNQLREFNAAAAQDSGGDTKAGVVLPARFVDAGLNASQVRIISAGGISCGMDAALHVVKMRFGEAEARETAELLDYAWRKTDGVQFDFFD